MTQSAITAFLVDDEKKSLSNLENLIRQYCSTIIIIGTSQKPLAAIEQIKKLQPAVLFLDIQASSKRF